MSQVLPLDYERTADGSTSNGFFSTIGWAIYLGMSWTWCIGMFLPVLLVRDYRIWGWIVFAIPNVIGAAAMGWTIRSREQSVALVAAHRGMAELFSFVTATFQIFFALWIFSYFGPRWGLGGWAVIPTALIGSLIIAKFQGWAKWASVVVLAISCVAMVGVYQSHQMQLPQDVIEALRYDNHHLYSVACLGVVCMLGFGLCPYLDLTFHRARQRTSQGPAAFGLGFGVFFLAMILFTLAYSTILLAQFQGEYWPNPIGVRGIAAHLFVQLAFTTALHSHELKSRSRRHAARTMMIVLASIVLAMLANWALRWIPAQEFRPGEYNPKRFYDPEPGETVYRFFMAFYGLIFPAYVWICMIPSWRTPLAPTRRAWIVFGAAVLLASPFYFATFIFGLKMIWIIPGVAIVLPARAFGPWKRTVETAYNR